MTTYEFRKQIFLELLRSALSEYSIEELDYQKIADKAVEIEDTITFDKKRHDDDRF